MGRVRKTAVVGTLALLKHAPTRALVGTGAAQRQRIVQVAKLPLSAPGYCPGAGDQKVGAGSHCDGNSHRNSLWSLKLSRMRVGPGIGMGVEFFVHVVHHRG